MNYYRKRRKTSGTGKVVTWLLVAFLVISLVPLLFSLGSLNTELPTEPPTKPSNGATQLEPVVESGVAKLTYGFGQTPYYEMFGNYNAISVVAKNYLPMEHSYQRTEEGRNVDGFGVVLFIEFDNGKLYAFWINNSANNQYVFNRFGVIGETGFGSGVILAYRDTLINDLINGDGAEFKLVRTGADTLVVSINGIVYDTYVMDGVTAENEVVKVGFRHSGNPGAAIEVPYVLTKAEEG